MSILLKDEVKICINELENHGFECFCVGGAVRDSILGQIPDDFDIATNALPSEVTKIFEKTIPTGIKHGTVTVIINNTPIEVTTYRTDGKYTDNRAPDSVTFVGSINDDLSRRDFTVNAICYNPKTLIYDPLNGIDDLKNKLIRSVGDPYLRFNEDALRILRAFRFSAQLNFRIEENTKTAALKLNSLLKNISVERIFVELKKGITSNNPERLTPLLLSGALEFLNIPRVEITDEIKSAPNNFAYRFALFSKISHVDFKEALNSFKSDNETIKKTEAYFNLLSFSDNFDRYTIKKLLNHYGIDTVNEFFKLNNNKTALEILTNILRNNEPYCLAMLNINGNELKKLGIEGEEIGITLEKLLDTCIKEPSYNTLEKLIKLLKNM